MSVSLMDSYKIINWDLNTNRAEIVYRGAKDDSGRGLKVKIIQNGVVPTITTETLRLYCEKQDGTHIYLDAEETLVDGYYIIILTNQVYAIIGNVSCQLRFGVGENYLKSELFTIPVTESLVEESIQSVNQYISLENALAKCDNLEDTYAPRLDALTTNLGLKVSQGGLDIQRDLDKNKSKIDQTMLTDTLLQQMAGTTPINAVPADNSLTGAKYVDSSVNWFKLGTSARNNLFGNTSQLRYTNGGGTVIDCSTLALAIKEIHLFNCDKTDKYYIQSYLYNYNGTYDITINAVSTGTTVCKFNTSVATDIKGVPQKIILGERNGSGINGWAIVDFSQWTSSNYFADTVAIINSQNCNEFVPSYPFDATATLKVNTTKFYALNNAIIDLRLFNANMLDSYYIYSYLNNYTGQWQLMIYSKTTGAAVCGCTLTSYAGGKIKLLLTSRNGSGITGYALINFDLYATSYFFTDPSATLLDKRVIVQENLSNDFYKSLFDSCICIGDSITDGYRDATIGTIRDKSYPTFLGRMTGWTIKNAGVSGITTKGWWNNAITTYDYTLYNVAIIKLGQNEGLTDTLVADTTITEGQTYLNYADTNTGDYCKIIEYIKEKNPNIKIFLVPTAPTNTVTNNVIQQIATKYELPYININNGKYFNLEDGAFHGSYGVHYNTVGYLLLAEAILKTICDYINTNYNNYVD